MGSRARKKEPEVEEQPSELAPRPSGYDDFMAPADRSHAKVDEAGLGAEDVDTGDVIMPRIRLLQSLSPEVADEEVGEAGQLWLTPHGRPLTWKEPKKGEAEGPIALKFVPVRIYPNWRRWNPKDDGGGLECEAAEGDLVARDPSGLTRAELNLAIEGGVVKGLEWAGGHPTNDCRVCVYGPGAAASAAGKEPSGRGNPWLPKLIEDSESGDMVRLPDEMRVPKCTYSIDVLGLVAVPPSGELPGEIVPAFVSFAKTSLNAGRSLSGMVKLASGEPVWSGIFELGSKKVTGEFTYYVMTTRKYGFANRRLMDVASELYHATKTQAYRPDMTDASDEGAASSGDSASTAPPRDDEPAPSDDF